MKKDFLVCKEPARSQSGASLVEFIIVIPIIFFFIVTFFDFGRFYYHKGMSLASAQRGVSLAQVISGLEELNVASSTELNSLIDSVNCLEKSNSENPGSDQEVVCEIQKRTLDLIKDGTGLEIQNYESNSSGAMAGIYTPEQALQDTGNRLLTLPEFGSGNRTLDQALAKEPIDIFFRIWVQPMSPWLSKWDIDIRAAGYRERELDTTVAVPLDCAGQRMDDPNYVPPTSCDCPIDPDSPMKWDPNTGECTICTIQGVDPAECACPAGTEFDPVTSGCRCTATCREDQEQVDGAPCCVCTEGAEEDSETGLCTLCPNGFKPDENGNCTVCPNGLEQDQNGDCTVCPEEIVQNCDGRVDENPRDVRFCCLPECDADERLDSESLTCIEICPDPLLYDPETGKCICPAGQECTMCPENMECECPDSTVWNPESQSCCPNTCECDQVRNPYTADPCDCHCENPNEAPGPDGCCGCVLTTGNPGPGEIQCDIIRDGCVCEQCEDFVNVEENQNGELHCSDCECPQDHKEENGTDSCRCLKCGPDFIQDPEDPTECVCRPTKNAECEAANSVFDAVNCSCADEPCPENAVLEDNECKCTLSSCGSDEILDNETCSCKPCQGLYLKPDAEGLTCTCTLDFDESCAVEGKIRDPQAECECIACSDLEGNNENHEIAPDGSCQCTLNEEICAERNEVFQGSAVCECSSCLDPNTVFDPETNSCVCKESRVAGCQGTVQDCTCVCPGNLEITPDNRCVCPTGMVRETDTQCACPPCEYIGQIQDRQCNCDCPGEQILIDGACKDPCVLRGDCGDIPE